MGEPCRLGLVALGDSITRGEGEPALGVPHRPWALWLAEALELPYTNHAVNGAVAEQALREQAPRVRVDYDIACLYLGVNDARGPLWDPGAFAAALEAILTHLHAHAARVLALTIPLDLGRPRAGASVPQANALIRELAREHGTLCVDLSDLRGPLLLLPDAVHPTALGQLEIADRAARTLEGAGTVLPTLPSAAADVHNGELARSRFAARWGTLLARDLARRGIEDLQRRR
jgi:lysophospholipase L1-like esterase